MLQTETTGGGLMYQYKGFDLKIIGKRSNFEIDDDLYNMRVSKTLEMIKKEIDNQNWDKLLVYFANHQSLQFVFDSMLKLKELELYEKYLIESWTGDSTKAFTRDALLIMLEIADRETLLSLGDEIPGDEPFTVYRGIAGTGAARRKYGLSWSLDYDKAKWFAENYSGKRFGLKNPKVFKTSIKKEDIFFYTDGRNESEVVCDVRDKKLIEVKPPKGD